MIALDLCQANYQVLLIIYLKYFIIISVQIVNSALITYPTKDNHLVFKWTECSKNHKKHFNKDLIKNFATEILMHLFYY